MSGPPRNTNSLRIRPSNPQLCPKNMDPSLLGGSAEGPYPGADLSFSRGGGWIFKKNSKILSTFFRSTKSIFRALPNFSWSNFCAVRKILKKRPKFSIYWRPWCLMKIFRVRHQIWISQNSTKGEPFGSSNP